MKTNLLALWTKDQTQPVCFQSPVPLYSNQKFRGFLSVTLTLLFLFVAGIAHGQQWQFLASEQDIATATSAYTNIVLVGDGVNSTPYVVYTESNIAKVKKFQDGTWTQVGGDISSGSATYTRIYNDKIGNIYVTYVDGANSNRLAVKKFNQTSSNWEPLNNNSTNLYVSSGSVTYSISAYSSTPRSSLAFDSNNTPYIAFGDGANLIPFVKKFNGTSWVTVGAGAVHAAAKAVGVSVVIDENDIPWLAFVSLATATSTTGSMALYQYSSGSWTVIAVPATVNGTTTGATTGIRHTSLALNAAGNLAIAYFNTSNSNKATVVVYNKTANTWSYSAAISTRDSPNISLITDISGNLFASFADVITNGSGRSVGRVFKQTGATTWTELKDPTVTTGIDEPVGSLSIAVGSDTSKPFIVYTKTNSAGFSSPIVRMFNPTSALAGIATKAVTNITPTSAVTGGDITSDGGSAITERGVVYSTRVNPTTADTKIADTSGGTGTFTTSLTGLAPYTVYSVRAYAISSSGTAYGANVTFTTPDVPDEIVTTPKQLEYLNRGVVAVRSSSSQVYVGWRLLGTDPAGIAFNVYRDGVKLNATPITTSTNFVDETAANGTYTVKPVLNGTEGAASEAVSVWSQKYLSIPMNIPAGGTTPDGVAYTYATNDCSVGDVDGDGEYEIFVKWDPSNAKDNSQSGYTGNVYIDCYKMNGTQLWRIDLGRNIRAGAHYTQFMVYDLDGDGKAEMACKTADGTIDGNGIVIGNSVADYRNSAGYVLSGPEFLTVFNGQTGAAMATKDYLPARGSVSSWGDSYGNRVDRFVAAVAYLDGARPSLVFGRGYYTRQVRVAWDWRDGQLTHRWTFDTNDPGNEDYAGQGNHQMTIGDVDGDGKDEIINGSSAINDNGRRLWSNRMGHGDALHMSDLDPDRPGQEIWICLESPSEYNGMGLRQYDARTGETLSGVSTTGDIGRAMAADVDPRYPGAEMWGSATGLYTNKGVQISTSRPTINAGIWWDGDLSRELLDASYNSTSGVSTVRLEKWNHTTNSLERLLTPSLPEHGAGQTNNTTKANAGLTADLFGDWREEIILRSIDNKSLLVYTTDIPTEHRIHTLMHDPQYRTAVAWQNSGYNQPPHPSFFLGNDMTAPAMPNIAVIDILPPAVTSIAKQEPVGELTNAASVTYQVNFSENVQDVDVAAFALTATGTAAGTIASVSAASGTSVAVTINGITGDGTLRLDVNSSHTGITDEAGNPLSAGFGAGEIYNIDQTAPVLPSVAMSSSNANTSYAKEGDIITLAFTASESIEAPVVTIAGREVEATAIGDKQYSAAYTLTGANEEGVVPFTIQFKDEAGNEGTLVSATTDGGTVTFYPTKQLVANASVDKPTLLVPNHKMVDITVSYGLEDRNYASVVLSVSSNEAEVGLGDDDIGPDWEIVDDTHVRLRAERSGAGNGRIYTITITATDIAGNVSTQVVTVTVPSNQKGQNVNAPVATKEVITLKIWAYPNPATLTQHFTLDIQSSSTLPLSLTVVDVMGRVIETRNEVAPNSSLTLGQNYQSGLYFIQVVQGSEKVVLKLVKKAE